MNNSKIFLVPITPILEAIKNNFSSNSNQDTSSSKFTLKAQNCPSKLLARRFSGVIRKKQTGSERLIHGVPAIGCLQSTLDFLHL